MLHFFQLLFVVANLLILSKSKKKNKGKFISFLFDNIEKDQTMEKLNLTLICQLQNPSYPGYFFRTTRHKIQYVVIKKLH